MTLDRQYIPAIGKSVKMRNWEDYTSRNVNVWAWLRVHSINSDGATVQVLNGSEPTGQIINIPLDSIQAPVGWQSRYTIHVAPDKVETVLSWFARGIVVRQSHDMSGSMPTAFQPMDNSEQPHWQFCEVTDAISAELCPQVFRVVKVEEEDIYNVYLVPDVNCKHCQGTGRRPLQSIADARGVSLESLDVSELRLENYNAASLMFDCHCIRGGFRNLGRSKRAKLIKQWESEGWHISYVPYAGGYWIRTRETIVHDWQ